ncbi:unnamed protein product [Ostreobium quekettii]|uniref:AAA+ ATPase domain-containing protein n=1 Tax=Ostreobium quekettii TaxID=121088 RepID=A0A8S1J8R9_9CHLO|nr:unnamed protein product [Ostreobium quekettii]|eukprot:evm.model.scf_128EXC.14 EVM.evm.TU.scf_128EXC.14   scf_128EXC:102494-107680(-)
MRGPVQCESAARVPQHAAVTCLGRSPLFRPCGRTSLLGLPPLRPLPPAPLRWNPLRDARRRTHGSTVLRMAKAPAAFMLGANPSWSRSMLSRRIGDCNLRCPPPGCSTEDEREGEDGVEDPGRSPRRSGRPWSWIGRLASKVRLEQFVMLLFNIQLLFFLLRLWPLGGRARVGDPQAVSVHVPFSEFVARVRGNDVEAVQMDGPEMSFSLRPSSKALREAPEGAESGRLTYTTTRPLDYPTPYDLLEQHAVRFSAVERRGNAFVTVVVYALYIGILLSTMGRLQLKLPQRSAGRKHQNNSSGSGGITFADVAGVDEAKEELEEIVDFLKNPEKFSRLGARPPCGVLLVGPPGTGKTMLAKAVAGEADVPFFSISASEFVELYVGMGAMRVRELFAQARKEAPSIVFIDEVDAVAKGRDARLRGVGNDEREQTLNQLLTELDGFDSNKDNVVITLAATNRPDVLDAALLRPGRFDRRVSVEQPDKFGREQILKVHMDRQHLPLADDVSVEGIAVATSGFTGADLANLVNEAALLAGRRSQSKVSMREFDEAVLRAVAGIEKKRSLVQGMEKEVVAKHEVGHALVGTAIARLLPMAPEVEKLSIIPRTGGSLGFTYIPPAHEDRALMFDSELRGQLAILMGGRAAEMITCGQISSGAFDDIKRATQLANRAVSELGLSTSVGPINVGVLALGSEEAGLFPREGGMASVLVEKDVKAMLEAALSVAADVVTTNRNIHEGLSHVLSKEERIEGESLQKWLSHIEIPSSLSAFVLQGTLPKVAPARREQ